MLSVFNVGLKPSVYILYYFFELLLIFRESRTSQPKTTCIVEKLFLQFTSTSPIRMALLPLPDQELLQIYSQPRLLIKEYCVVQIRRSTDSEAQQL